MDDPASRPPVFPPDAVRACLDRIVASAGFSRSRRLVGFLRFTVEALLEGRVDEIKERTIAIEVYGRSLEYDPACDPIVRSEAYRLRSKLDAYYAAEGAADPILIDLPKGAYTPELRSNTATPDDWTAACPVFVVPFEDGSREADDTSFARAIADAVRERLAGRPGLRVMNRASGPRVDSVTKVPPQVEYVVDGAFARTGSRCRVRVRLVRQADGEEIWSNSHRFAWSRMAEAQDELAEGVASAIGAFLTRTGRPPLPAGARAYELYVKGRHSALQYGNTFDLRHLEPARRRIAAALELEPRFTDALAELANLELMQLYPPRDDAAALVKRAREHLERALAIEPRHARSLSLLGHALAASGQHRQALGLTETALAVDPEDPEARTLLAARYTSLGFWESALAACDWAFRLDPVWEATHWVRLSLLHRLGRVDKARTALAEADAWADAPVELAIERGLLHLAEGDPHGAVEVLSSAFAEHPERTNLETALGLAAALAADRVRARRVLEARRHDPPYYRDFLIRLALASGEGEVALALLTRSPFHRNYRWLATEPLARPLLREPPWRSLLEELHAAWLADLEEVAPRLPAPPPPLPGPEELLRGSPGARPRSAAVAGGAGRPPRPRS